MTWCTVLVVVVARYDTNGTCAVVSETWRWTHDTSRSRSELRLIVKLEPLLVRILAIMSWKLRRRGDAIGDHRPPLLLSCTLTLAPPMTTPLAPPLGRPQEMSIVFLPRGSEGLALPHPLQRGYVDSPRLASIQLSLQVEPPSRVSLGGGLLRAPSLLQLLSLPRPPLSQGLLFPCCSVLLNCSLGTTRTRMDCTRC